LGKNCSEKSLGKGDCDEENFREEEIWAELVIHGIGGKTIAEAKRNLSHREFCFWRQYIETRGSLNFGLRLDERMAALKYMYAKSNSFDVSDQFDFMPYHDAPDIGFEEAMQMYGGE